MIENLNKNGINEDEFKKKIKNLKTWYMKKWMN
jgi:hypothetical protein